MSAAKVHGTWLSAPATRAVMAALEAMEPGCARFVGGCVRNGLLNEPVDDVDIATTLLPNEVMTAGTAAGLKVVPTGLAHGTITLVAHKQPFEVTSLRSDVQTDGRHALVVFTRDWAQDAQRRDFHLNALYADAEGNVFDPTQRGLEDVRARRVAFVGDASARIREDYLRILRFFRFSAWYGGGALSPEGLAACASEKAGLAGLSVERVWKEVKRLLAAADPRAALAAMCETGVLALCLPELAGTQARALGLLDTLIEADLDHHFAADPLLRLAGLLCASGAEAAERLATRLRLSRAESERLLAALKPETRMVSYLSPREVRRALYRVGVGPFRDQVRLAWAAQAKAKAAPQWRALLALADSWQRPALALTGEEIMAAGAPAGPMVGMVRMEVEAWWIDSDFPDDKLAIVERLKAVVQALA